MVDLSNDTSTFYQGNKKISEGTGNRIEKISKTKMKILPNMKMTPIMLRNVQRKLHVKSTKAFTYKVGKT